MLEYNGLKVSWEGHATVRIEDKGFTVIVDPYSKVCLGADADLILITHADTGHFDPNIIKKCSSEKTCVVVPESIEEENVPCRDVEQLSEGESIDIYGVEIEGIPMENQLGEHEEGIGFRFKMRDKNFYVAGDTGLTQKLLDLEGIADLAFLPVDGEYTMDVDEAVNVAARIKPDIVVPYHYGKPFFDHKEIDLRSFKAELEDRNIRCNIMEPEN